MITFFTIPKAFEGRSDWIQRNAVGSWLALGDTRVVLFGDDPGVADAALDLGVEHESQLERTPLGTPRLDAAFSRARELAAGGLLCYVNADMLLLDDFGQAADRVAALDGSSLGVGESWDTPVDGPLEFSSDWQSRVRSLAPSSRRRGAGALDYFLFTDDLFAELPPFAVGRVGFDNWLVWSAGAAGARVIDLTPSVRAIHQRHDYAHVVGGHGATRQTGEEGRYNIELAGPKSHLHTRYDATHILGRRRLRRNLLRTFRLKENVRKLVYKARSRTPWPPADRRVEAQ